uniref:KNTC1 second ARM-repeats domain-containing protein n=1 Tax=Globisporangium ultimum (strain ATCC 200006 / CBS 805.95 / DAOM BR144) TaxID=431595 RepID=K3WD72_GLOUD
MSMLDRVSSPDQLHHEIDYHAKKYLRFCGSQADPVLRDYVTELAESIQTAKSTEEARALVVLNSIDDIEIRADAALALLRSVLPPYSQKLKMFAKSDAMSWGSKRQEEIEEHLRLMEIQDMLMAYGIRQFDIADSRNVSRLLDHILSQISRTSALDDAMRLVDAYSHLHCERAILQFVENMLTFPCGHESKGQVVDLDTEISWRTEKAVIALKHVKKRIDVGTNPLLLISLMEEVIELGLTLIEIEEEKQSAAVQLVTLKFREHDGMRGLEDEASSSFVLSMVAALAAAFLPEIQSLNDAATSTRNEIVSDYVKSSDFALNEKLISDLQKLKRIEAEHRILLSISTLRDPEKIEIKLKQLMKPDILFADDGVPNEQGTSLDSMLAQSSLAIGRGKGKKRAAGWAAEDVQKSLGMRTG